MFQSGFLVSLEYFIILQVVAVGARKQSDADEFAKKFDIPKAYGSYEEVAKDPNVGTYYTYIGFKINEPVNFILTLNSANTTSPADFKNLNQKVSLQDKY